MSDEYQLKDMRHTQSYGRRISARCSCLSVVRDGEDVRRGETYIQSPDRKVVRGFGGFEEIV